MWKRRLISLLAAGLLLTMIPAKVVADEPQINAEVDGRRVNLYTVNLTLDNQYLASDVPPVLMEHQGQHRTLVPVAAIASYTGAVVSWNGDREEVTIVKGDKTILLQINSAVVLVNGEEKALPSQVPAKIVTYQDRGRTMVPANFVAQELGLLVAWDEGSRTVRITTPEPIMPPPATDMPDVGNAGEDSLLSDLYVVMNGDNPEIRLKTGREVQYSFSRLTGPDRLVFDLDQTLLAVNDSQLLQADKTVRLTPPANPYLEAVRSSQFELNPSVVRLVLDMKEMIGHQIFYDESAQEMVIRLINYVDDVRFERFNTQEVVVIEGTNVADYQVMHLNGPDRLVVDIRESILNPSRKILDQRVGGRIADQVRVSDFKPDHHYHPTDKIVRVVVDLNRQIDPNNLYIQENGSQLMVHLEGIPQSGFRYEETGWTTSRLTFFGQERVNYEVIKDAGTQLIRAIMPADNMTIPFESLEVNDPLLEFIHVTEGNGGRELVADIQLKAGVETSNGELANVSNLVLEFTNRDLKYREKLVVIDAGHGGSDPGAISTSLKMQEKDVVLEVAKEAQRLLEAAGFRVYMTRTSDTYISIQDRAEVANQLRADLFVSIHANSATRSDIKGVETLYYPSEVNPLDFRDNKFLAEIFQREMVRTLGAASHRINAREKLVVLRETRMPAIITEIGFLSNPEEERLLAMTEYRRLAAEGVARSVIRYFEESLTHLLARP